MKLAVRVEFLTGRYIATNAFDRKEPEWPAHPARFYSACTAALHDGEVVDPQERDALSWLSTLGPPAIKASEASVRASGQHFVPVNDASLFSDLSDRRYKYIEEALAVIEQAPTPRKVASAKKKLAKQRDVEAMVEHTEGKKGTKETLLPQARSRKDRYYPSVTPDVPTQWFIWEISKEEFDDHATSLERVFYRVTRIGHSSSFVSVSLDPSPPEPNLIPSSKGKKVLRTVDPGQLERLEEAFLSRALQDLPDGVPIKQFVDISPRTMPHTFTAYAYSDSLERDWTIHHSNEEGEWISFKVHSGAGYHIQQTYHLCRTFRQALMSYAPDPTSPYLSGHEDNGEPTRQPHLKVLALPFVNHRYGTGEIKGIALILPRSGNETDISNIYQAIRRWEESSPKTSKESNRPLIRFYSTSRGDTYLERSLQPELRTIMPQLWQGPSRRWTTVTPIMLDRNPKFFGHNNEEKHSLAVIRMKESIGLSCLQQGLPILKSINVSQRPFFGSTNHCRVFSSKMSENRRFMIHADLLFAQPIQGPLSLGAGRFFGMGLCLPGREDE